MNSLVGAECQGTGGTICTENLLSDAEARPFWADAVEGLVRVGTGKGYLTGSQLHSAWRIPTATATEAITVPGLQAMLSARTC